MISLWDLLVILGGCTVFGAVLGIAMTAGAGRAGLVVAIPLGLVLSVFSSYLHWKAGERITATGDGIRTERRLQLLYAASALWIILAAFLSGAIVKAAIKHFSRLAMLDVR